MAIDALFPDPAALTTAGRSTIRRTPILDDGRASPIELLNNGEAWSAYHAITRLGGTDERALVTGAKIAIELARFDTARRLLNDVGPSALASTERLVVQSDLAARTGRYSEHHGLVVRLARYHDLTDLQVGALALQTAEIAVLTDHHELACRMFATAAEKLRGSPVHQLRCLIGWQLIARATGGHVGPATHTHNPVLGPVLDGYGPLGALTRLLDVAAGHSTGAQQIAEIRATRFALRNAGLIELSQRALTMLKVRAIDREPIQQTPPMTVMTAAQCPWVTNDEMFAAADRALELDIESHFWVGVVGCRFDDSPHPAIASETGEVLEWAHEIRRQELENNALEQSIAQMRDRWRDLANLTSNEIRGLLTSLDAASYLSDIDDSTPRGLELSIVRRVGALATMTLLGASELPSELHAEHPCNIRALLASVLAEEQAIFDWQGNVLESRLDIGDEVVVVVDPAVLDDLFRWLIISASTGHLSRTKVEVVATTTDLAVEIRIHSSGETIDPPWNQQVLGMSRTTVAYRAAAVTLAVWDGSFDVVYKNSRAELVLTLPIGHGRTEPHAGDSSDRPTRRGSTSAD